MYINYSPLLPWLQPAEPTLEELLREEYRSLARKERNEQRGERQEVPVDLALLLARTVVSAGMFARIV